VLRVFLQGLTSMTTNLNQQNYQSLQKIKNGLGRFIDKADTKAHYSCRRICIEVDLEARLLESVKLKVGAWKHFQKMDYEQLLFKCRRYHEYGHFQRNFPKAHSIDKEDGEGWKQPQKSKAIPKLKVKKNAGPATIPQTTHEA
jgi:hypothetical protein